MPQATTPTTTGATTTGALASGVDADADPAGRAGRAWLVAPLTPEQDVRSLAGLRGIMEQLYSPDGCPWDYEQTHESLRGYLIEETYEAIEAIDGGDLEGLCEELGDILLQVFFHAVVAETAGTFTLDDVAETIARKMVRRHPHVFGDAERGSTADEQWTRWDAIKAAERAAAGKTGEDDSPFASLPLSLPALQRAQSVQGRASRAGLADAPSAGEALSALSGSRRRARGWTRSRAREPPRCVVVGRRGVRARRGCGRGERAAGRDRTVHRPGRPGWRIAAGGIPGGGRLPGTGEYTQRGARGASRGLEGEGLHR